MIPKTKSEMFKRIRPYLVGLFFALMFLYIAVNSYRVVSLAKHYDGWEATTTANHSVVTTVDPNGPAAGLLHEGDQIVTVNGLEFQGEGLGGALNRAYSKIEPGDAYTLGIRRAGQQQEGASTTSTTAGASDLETITLHTQAAPNARIYGRFAGLVGIILIFYLAGLIIFLIKPMDKQSILLALILGMFAAFPQGIKSGASGLPTWFYYLLQAPIAASTLFFAPVFLHFFLIFPEGERPLSPMLRRWPRLERYIYYPILFFFIPASVLITVVMMLITKEQRAALGARLSLLAAHAHRRGGQPRGLSPASTIDGLEHVRLELRQLVLPAVDGFRAALHPPVDAALVRLRDYPAQDYPHQLHHT
jgi:hypothetical protein